mgnify:CR=1 FL=1
MRPYRDGRFTRIGLILFFIVVILYGLYEAQGLLVGPTIAVSSETITSPEAYVKIEGQAQRIASLSMNGKEISVTEIGEFSEPYLLARGSNRITLEARDKYGRETRKVIEIVYSPAPGAETAVP